MGKAMRGHLIRQGLDQIDMALGKNGFDDGDDHIVIEHPPDLIFHRLIGRRKPLETLDNPPAPGIVSRPVGEAGSRP